MTVIKEICNHLTVLNYLRQVICVLILSVIVHVEHVQGVDKIMETLRNCGIELVCVGLCTESVSGWVFADGVMTCLVMIRLGYVQDPPCCQPRWPVWSARGPSPVTGPVRSPLSGSSLCR